jgi:serine/threonine protein kinase
VVDNSRSTFGADDAAGGLLGDGDWQPIELVPVVAPPPAAPVVAPALPRVDFTVRTDTATYRVTETLARGEIATIYGGRAATNGAGVALKVADDASDNDLLQHEVRVLGLVLATPHKTALHFAPPRDQFRTGDGRLGSVFDRLDGLDLTAIRDGFRRRGEPGLPARHVVWILRRALAALGWAHHQGILHGNLDPSHVLVRGRDHMVWLVDWCWAVVNPAQTGQGFKALNETYSPPEVAARGRPTPASDLYALGKCAIHVLGGDPAAKTVPDGVDARLARFLRYLCVESQGGRGQDAWELYTQLDKLREQIWGKHEFVPLDLPHSNGERN